VPLKVSEMIKLIEPTAGISSRRGVATGSTSTLPSRGGLP
jgi:hypothetical protein